MTIGQRIAQKRKELGLSQEALGERLGVSRQAIYKWESDAATPEVEKLIALSHIFSVSVGWLLGVEEEAPKAESPQSQEDLIEEVLRRYQESQPAPPAPLTQAHWKPLTLAVLCFVILAAFFILFTRLNTLQNEYAYLQNSINRIDQNVQSDISGLAFRVEEILQQQNNLTAEYQAEILSFDLAADTVTFSVFAVPKTYVDGMTARFSARSGDQTIQVKGTLDAHKAFSATVTCPISSDITLSVAFLTGGKEETQLLRQYDWLQEYSEPSVMVDASLFGYGAADRNGYLCQREALAVFLESKWDATRYGEGPKVQSLQVGFFEDGVLQAWYEEITPDNRNYCPEAPHTHLELRENVLLEAGAVYTIVGFVTDQFGRQFTVLDGNYQYDPDSNLLSYVYDGYTEEYNWLIP